MPRYRVVVEELGDERELPVREPAAELEFSGTGPARGEWEETEGPRGGGRVHAAGAVMTVRCRDCGRVRLGVTLATFVCRFCLSLRGRRVRP